MTETPAPEPADQTQPEVAAPVVKQTSPWIYFMPVPVALILGIMIGMAIPSGNSGTHDTVVTTPQAGAPAGKARGNELMRAVERRDAEDVAAAGPVDAPIVMVAFSDFQCPYCAKWEAQTLPALIKKYVNTGKVRIEWRDLEIFGKSSGTAAKAALAAGAQDAYVPYRALMTKGGKSPSDADFSDENLRKTATELNIDPDKFLADLKSAKVTAQFEKNIAEARRIGVSSTPMFLINTVPMSGAQPLASFEQILDEQLAAAGQN